MNIMERYAKIRASAKDAGSDMMASVALMAAIPVAAAMSLQESSLRSAKIVGFEPLSPGSYNKPPTTPTNEQIRMPYGSIAKVVFRIAHDEEIEALLQDLKDTLGQAQGRRKYAGAKLIWGRKVRTRSGQHGPVHYVEDPMGSVEIQAKSRPVSVQIPDLDAVLEHNRPPKDYH